MLATVEPAAGTRYSTADALGSPRVVTNAAGAVVSRHDYQPYGEELLAGTGGRSSAQGYGGADNLRQHFTGYERDAETGLDFAQARYYSGASGRFTSPDPLQASASAMRPQSWNRYAYTYNNPLKYSDPSGMLATREPIDYSFRHQDYGVYAQADGGSWSTYEEAGRSYEVTVTVLEDTGVLIDTPPPAPEPQEPSKPSFEKPTERAEPDNPCVTMSKMAQRAANEALEDAEGPVDKAVDSFDAIFNEMWYVGARVTNVGVADNLRENNFSGRSLGQSYFGQAGFRTEFKEADRNGNVLPDTHDQTHHFAAYFSAGMNAYAVGALRFGQWVHRNLDNAGDNRLGAAAFTLGRELRANPTILNNIGGIIRTRICGP